MRNSERGLDAGLQATGQEIGRDGNSLGIRFQI